MKLSLLSIVLIIPFYQDYNSLASATVTMQNPPAEDNARKLQLSSGTVLSPTTLQVVFVGCEMIIDENDGSDNILCAYTKTPVDLDHRATLTGISTEEKCNRFVAPVGGISINEGNSGPINDVFPGEFEVYVDVREGGADTTRNSDGSYETTFCIMNELLSGRLGESFYTHYTKVTCKFTVNGGFQIENISLNEVENYQDEEELEKSFGVLAYQCDITPPYTENSKVLNDEDNLGVCIEAVSDTTYIESVITYTVSQPGPFGEVVASMTYITDTEILPGSVIYDCTLTKPGSTFPGSMCFIEAALVADFFENVERFETDLPLTAEGVVDLRVRNTINNVERRNLHGVGDSHDDITYEFDEGSDDTIKVAYGVDFLVSATILRSLNQILFFLLMLYHFVFFISLFI